MALNIHTSMGISCFPFSESSCNLSSITGSVESLALDQLDSAEQESIVSDLILSLESLSVSNWRVATRIFLFHTISELFS